MKSNIEDPGSDPAFSDPSQQLQADLLEFIRRGATEEIVARRAKAVSILRKADEFMRTHNPSPATPQGMILALSQAAERMGLKLTEYDDIVRGDAELLELERRVLEDARKRS